MANRTRRGVMIKVDEDFFDILEKERVREQQKLRKKIGGMFNLTQRNFTALLAKRNFKFKIPSPRITNVVRRRRK